jgi:TolB-like protein/tetratricopeptide (TPR) repeat protein/DNA-binding winged helix-turn-helix (wHTH) protein
MVMEPTDLRTGFQLGDWVVEPELRRISGNGTSRSLELHHVRILLKLAARHGEVVDRSVLRDHAWPCQQTTQDMLRTAIHELRDILGDSPRDPRYIVRVARRGYALIAHVEPLLAPDRAVSAVNPASVANRPSFAGRMLELVSEARRRHVFRVLGAYLVGMWILLQIAETTFEPLHLPGWWMTALTILTVTGIPIVAVLAWSYEITASGVVLDGSGTGRYRLPHARRAMAPLLVLGVALMAGVTGLAWWRSLDKGDVPVVASTEAPPRSIAVLPLVDMSPQGDSAYLGEGLSDELSAQLAQVPGMRVAARTSAFEFKGKNLDVRRIGEALGVRNVLEGSVRRDGDKLRVTVQLIDTSNGYHIWASTYDRDWADVIAIQDDISRSITEALAVVLTPEARQKLQYGDVTNIQAYDHYLEGVAALHTSGDMSQLEKAGDAFRKALALEPGMSRAYAGICQVGIKRYLRTSAPTDVADAEGACRKALALDPSREETEMALARLYTVSGRHEQAEAVYRELARRRPGDADVYVGLGEALNGQGQREEAERNFRKAIEVEPAYAGGYTALGNFLFQSGRSREAIDAYRRATELVPGSASAYSNLGAALFMSARLTEAARAFERSITLEPSRAAQSNLGSLYYYLGDYPKAVRHYESAEALASQDNLVVGNLADALWQIEARRAEAVRLYERAAQLAEASLKVNPSDGETWARLAYFSSRAGDAERSARAEARAEVLGEEQMYVHYYIALIEADRRDLKAARAAIERAEQLGYPRDLIMVDPVLKHVMNRDATHADQPVRS